MPVDPFLNYIRVDAKKKKNTYFFSGEIGKDKDWDLLFWQDNLYGEDYDTLLPKDPFLVTIKANLKAPIITIGTLDAAPISNVLVGVVPYYSPNDIGAFADFDNMVKIVGETPFTFKNPLWGLNVRNFYNDNIAITVELRYFTSKLEPRVRLKVGG